VDKERWIKMTSDGKYSPGQVNGKPRPGSDSKLSQNAQRNTAEPTADEISIEDYLTRQSHSPSGRGQLEKPLLQPYNVAFLDARSRGRIAILITVFFGATIILGAAFLVTDSLLGKNPAALIDYLKYTINLIETIVLLAVGYLFGARSAGKKLKA
jgi:hypothetical protein